MVKYCPYCGKDKLETVGIMASGAILRCLLCELRFVVADPDQEDI